MASSNNVNSLEGIDFNGVYQPINSPHSLQTVIELGIDPKKLFHISFKEYIQNHLERQSYPKDIQERYYEQYEQRRKNRIDKCKTKRREIIMKETEPASNPKSNSKSKSKSRSKSRSKERHSMYHSLSNINLASSTSSSFLQREMQKLEKIRQHQIQEVKSIIDYEINMSNLRKANEEKLRQIKEREEMQKMNYQRFQSEKIIQRRQDEIEKEEQIKREIKLKQQHFKHIKAFNNENHFTKIEHNQLKHNDEFQRKMSILKHIEQKQYNSMKIKDSDSIEEIQMKITQLKQKETHNKMKEMQRKQFEKLEEYNHKKEEEAMKKRKEFEEKQMKKALTIQKQTKELNRRRDQHSQQMRKKEEKITNFTHMNQLLSNKRREEYSSKMDYYENRRKSNNEATQQLFYRKIMQRQQHHKENSERFMQHNSMIYKKHEVINDKLSNSEEKIRNQKEKSFRGTINKLVNHGIKLEENSELKQEYDKQMELKKNMTKSQLIMKEKHVENMLKMRMSLMNNTLTYRAEMKKRREEMLFKMKTLLKTGEELTKEDVYRKVFTSEELNCISNQQSLKRSQYQSAQYSPNHTNILSNDEMNDSPKNTPDNPTGNGLSLFVTQEQP